MKKVTGLLLVVLMTLTMLLGIGGTAMAGEAETLTMWYWKGGIDEGIIAAAQEEFGINIEAEVVGGDFLAKITTTLAGGGELPDILLLNDWLITLMPNADRWTNLLDAPYNAGEIKDQYYEWKWNMALTADGQTLIALPIDTAPTALFYRADLFEQAGLEFEPDKVAEAYDTWDKMFAVGDQLYSATGSYLFDNIEMVFMQSLAQIEGNHFFDTDDNFMGDQAHVRECFDNAVKANEMGVLMNVNNWTPEWNAAVNNGDVAAFVGGVWMQSVLKDSAPDTAGQWRVAPAPGGPGNQGGSFISVPASSKNPELAYNVIKWMVSPENNVREYVDLGVFPSTPAAFEDDTMFVADDFFGGQVTAEVFKKVADEMPIFYMAPRHNNFRDFFTNELYLVSDQDKNPEDAWNDAVSAAQRELEK